MREALLFRLIFVYVVVSTVALIVGFIIGGNIEYRLQMYWVPLLFFVFLHVITALALYFYRFVGYCLFCLFLLFSVVGFDWCLRYEFVPLISIGISLDSNFSIGYFYYFLTYYEISYKVFCDDYRKVGVNLFSLFFLLWVLLNKDGFLIGRSNWDVRHREEIE